MNVRRVMVLTVGLVQVFSGASMFIVACGLGFDLFDVHIIPFSIESTRFHLLTLLGFGFFCVVSGFFLLDEWLHLR